MDHVWFSGRHGRKGDRPELPTYEGQRIRKRGQRLLVPGSLPKWKQLPMQQVVGEDRHHRKERQQRGDGPQGSEVRPLALRFHAEVGPHFVKGHFHLPAPHKPFDDLLSRVAQIRTQQRLWRELTLGVTNQHLTHHDGRHPTVIPHCCCRCDLKLPPCATIPLNRGGLPLSGGIKQG